MIIKEKNRYEPTKSIFAVFGDKEPNATVLLLLSKVVENY